MNKGNANKQISKSENKNAEVEAYNFPQYNKIINASSLEEAQKILAELLAKEEADK